MSESCPKCGIARVSEEQALYLCDSCVRYGRFVQSDRCVVRAKDAALAAATKRADEAEDARIDATESHLRSNMLLEDAEEKLDAAEQENARLREGTPHHVVDWPDSEGNWWNNRASYPCRVTRSGCGELLIGSEQSDKWVGRKEWESLMGKTRWAKMSEENPLPMAW